MITPDYPCQLCNGDQRTGRHMMTVATNAGVYTVHAHDMGRGEFMAAQAPELYPGQVECPAAKEHRLDWTRRNARLLGLSDSMNVRL